MALLVAAVTAACAAPADAPLLAKIEDVQDAAALVAGEARYDAVRDRLPLKDACDVARGAILEGRLRDAIECAMRTFYLGQEMKDAKLTAEGARVLAEAYGFAGKLDLSSRFAKLALREAARLLPGDRERNATEAIAWRVLGENWSRESRWTDALDAFKRAESLPAVSTFSRDTLAIAVANTQLRAGTPAIAREAFSRIAGRDAAPARVRVALRGLGDALAAENRPAEARDQFRAALRLARSSGNLAEIA
jgi:tetratricopeptide (TPR) repeat protein